MPIRPRHIEHLRPLITALSLAVLAGASACSDDGADAEPAPQATEAARPLQPLIYTEHPDQTPRGAAVAERRLMRQLLEGADEADWGKLKTERPRDLPTLGSAEALGEAVVDALVDRDEALWDHVFVHPDDYALMVHLEPAEARDFVDAVQGDSQPVWEQFQVVRASEAPQGGLASVFEFVSLELGEPRTVAGPIAAEGEPVAQYWGNVLRVGLEASEVVFELRIPKILRIANPRHGQGPALGIASPVTPSQALEVFLDGGLHLKAELLRSREYPLPLKVGNFWRYRRLGVAAPSETSAPGVEADPGLGAADGATEATGPVGATEVLLEVVSVDKFDTRRLVRLRRSYNDAKLTTAEQDLLVMPRRIYRCPQVCRNHVRDLPWLLTYLERTTPIYTFPLRLDQQWPAGDAPTFTTAKQWQDVEVPAGSFTNAIVIDGDEPIDPGDPFERGTTNRRFFAHGDGVVRRVLRDRDDPAAEPVVEELVEYRIMP